MSNPGDYTVGWICAIVTEYIAAQEFLDEEHEGPEYIAPNDNNDYTLGKVGKHNIVIAVLPQGEYGISSATGVAKDMLSTFPNIRIGLMVGIGGGAPSPNHDIRLGDIVVSAVSGGKGGVFQCDFGKDIQDQDFQETGLLNQPPTVLRTAVNGLMAQYKRKGHQFEETIRCILEKNPRLWKEYKRPDLSSDRLYRTEVVHPPNSKESCVKICDTDPSKLMPRRERTEDEDNPAIHYGLIASANRLMKNAVLRDKLAKDKDVLCFEMEAAGLMNHFPCLVIRGICDYSDSHKNKEWQGYAAMVAAAYAKDLLYRIPPTRVEAEKRISDVLSSDVKKMHSTIQDASDTVKILGIEHRREKIERWLQPPDPSTNWNKAWQQRHKDSGLWFLRNEVFAKWKTRRNSFLCLYGIPGCGKTILSSAIIEDLEKNASESQTILYFYFDFNDTSKQSFESMIRSLISQLYCKRKDTQKQLDSLFCSCKNGSRQPTTELLCTSFLDMILQVSEVWIILDALDECRTRKGTRTEGLLSWIKDVVSSKVTNVSLLVTSRPEQDIVSAISEWAYNKDLIPIKSGFITDDIRAYVRTRVREDDGLKRWRSKPDIQEEIETKLIDKTDGMFRWAACQLDALESCLDYFTLQKALISLPKTLDDTYARILHSIPHGYKQNAIRILQFLTFSERPLRIEEVVDAIAVQSECNLEFNPKNRMPEPMEVTRYCSSMVTIVTRSDSTSGKEAGMELQLAHFSVKEYLTSGRLDGNITQYLQETAAKTSIAKVCLIYLLHLDQDILVQKIRDSFPLAQYCAQYWIGYAAASKEDKKLHGLIMDFFLYRKRSYINWFHLWDPDLVFGGSGSLWRGPADALYYASIGGLKYEVEDLVKRGADINTQGGYFGNALQAASIGGHEDVVRVLLDNGADVNAQGGHHDNALYAASEQGHEKIVQVLLDNGAKINAQGGDYSNALLVASIGGHEKVVQVLLETGKVNINARGRLYGNTALHAASERGHEKIAQALLGKGADVNAQGGRYGNALQAASLGGHEDVVQVLLDNGADVNAQGGHCGNALQTASQKGHEKIIQVLLDNGANINAQGGHYGNALQAASEEGHEKIVQVLLDNGANINAQGGHYGNALQAASEEGHEKIVQVLLDNGADVNAQGGHYGNALQAASEGGHEKIVQVLLDNGADVNAQGGHCGNALQAASLGGHEDVVQVLLDNGADVNAQGGLYGNALQAASVGGHEDVVQLLLDNGANINALGGYYSNALQAASVGGHEKIVQVLIDNGANINALCGDYGNALRAASEKGHEKVVQVLLDNGADVNAQGGHCGNALQTASRKGHEDVVQVLLDNGADVNAQEGLYGNALQAASLGGHEDVVQVLLDNGADVNAQGGRYGNALYAASEQGHETVVQVLIDNGADVNAQWGYYGNALQAAFEGGHEKVIRVLLETGKVDINVEDIDGLTQLLYATSRWREAIFKLLSKHID